MKTDVVCGMLIDPAKAAGHREYSGADVLLLLEAVPSQVRRRPQPVRHVRHRGRCGRSARPHQPPSDRRCVMAVRCLRYESGGH